ncbi:ABC transporter substrate-binding protein [Rhodobacteraceae bacterium 2CG4]|uniref:ABC transporter substrate-binding protein n=1 Tax=Halovulum marinum TaxID=2662447 RepID=A0A6L5Z443_9RHOB|nr:extracellular solute-binding protein [Halovulum marinum]MSU90792.1 ABC transporter substrate-binding protein [Halovulum marinum]
MKALGRLLAVSAISAVAAPALAQTEVIWWDFLSGGDGVRMKALIEDFNAQHPDIQISGTTLEWGVPFYTKVRTSAAVGEGPDVMTYHLSRVPLGLEEGVLSPITDEDLQNAELTTDDFFASSIEAATSDGELYAVPFDIHALILYYNKALLEGSAWLDADGNLTGIDSLEDFEAALAWLKDNGVETPLTFQTGGAGGVWRVFYTLLSQQGGEFIVDGEVLPGDNAEKAANAIDTMARWQQNGWIPEQAEYEASVALYGSGEAAFQLNGVWEVPTFNDMEEKGTLGFGWGAVEIPPLMGQAASWADSHAFAIPNEGDDTVSGEKRAAVMTVIGWMEQNALRWADAGHIPAYKPVADSAEYAAMEPNATYASLADNTAFDPPSTITGVASPTYDTALNIISPAIHGYFSGAEAVEQIKAELQAMMQ